MRLGLVLHRLCGHGYGLISVRGDWDVCLVGLGAGGTGRSL